MRPKAVTASMLLLLACAAARAQDRPVELIDEYVGIRFEHPKGIERLSDEETAREFGTGGRLKVVFNDSKNTMLLILNVLDREAYGLPTGSMKDSQKALRQKLESEVMAGVSDVKWISRDVIEINSLPWLHLRYKFSSGDEIASDTYATVWGERIMVFTYSCTAGNYERLRADFEKSAASIQLFLSVPVGSVEEEKPAVRRGKRKRKP